MLSPWGGFLVVIFIFAAGLAVIQRSFVIYDRVAEVFPMLRTKGIDLVDAPYLRFN
jgi:hypothetical protein